MVTDLLRLALALAALGTGGARAQDGVDPLAGTWLGTVTAPQGRTAIGFAFARTADGLAVRMDMPAMFVHDADLGLAEEREGRITIAPLDTELHLAGGKLVGTFALSKLPIELARGGAFPQPPVPPVDPPGPQPLWTSSLGAPSWASPIVRDGVIYVGAVDGKFRARRATDGGEVWTSPGFARIDGRAVATDDSLYFVDGKPTLTRLHRVDGTFAWGVPLHDAALAGKPAPDNPTYNRRVATPLVADGIVYVGSSDGGAYAFDASSGRKQWRTEAGAPIFAGAALLGPDRVLFACMDGALLTLERRTGKELARAAVGGAIVTTPVVAGERIVVGGRDYLLRAVALDGKPVWSYSYWFSWVESTPQLVDGVLYVGASDFRRVTALEPQGGKALWSTDVRGMAWGWPVVTADAVFVGTAAQSGTIIDHGGGIVALDRKTGALKWRRVVPPPAGAAIWGYAGSLALAGDALIAAGLDGSLAAFPTN